MGWANLARKYRTRDEFDGVRLGAVTAYVNQARYREGLIIRYNHNGIYFRPIVVFRLFHPPIFIPWADITEVREREIVRLGFRGVYKELMIGNPFIAAIQLKKSTFSKMESEVIRHSIKQNFS